MSGVVRIEALRALAALIEANIPELLERVCTGVAPSSEHEAVPNLSIQPTKWSYQPEQAGEHVSLPGNVLVWNVGEHECAMVLSLVTATPAQRWELEAKILDLFLSSVHPLTGYHRAGVVVLPVAACPQLGEWFCSFELDSDEWNDTLALDRRYESRMVITAHIPALTIERPVYTLNELILGVTEDMDTTLTVATAIPPTVELITINEDGTISRHE